MSRELHPSFNANELWTYGLPQTSATMDGDIPIHPALHSQRILGVIFGSDTNAQDKEAFLSDFRNKAALVPGIQGLLVTAPSHVWTPQLQSTVEQHLPNTVSVYRVTIIEAVYHHEATITHVRDRGALSSWSSASIPLDEVNLETTTQILSLPNLRILTFLPPNEPLDFGLDRATFKDAIQLMLMSFDTLRTIKMPLDFLGDVSEILFPLREHKSLTTLEFKLPTTTSLFPLSTNEVVREEISMALTEVIQSLRRLEVLAIPMEITSPNVLRAIGHLPRLKMLKVSPIGDMGGATFLNVALMNGIPSLESFRSLQTLHVAARRTSESDLTRLARRFPGVKIV